LVEKNGSFPILEGYRTSTVGESLISTSQTDGDRADVTPTTSMGESSGSDDAGGSTVAGPRWRPASVRVRVD